MGQGKTQQEAVDKLKEAFESVQLVRAIESKIYTVPISIEELNFYVFNIERAN